MRIAIIGAGFTGLTAAYELTKRGHNVTVFEKEKTLGGLAHGFRRPGWEWYLEYAYHHLFTNDHAILALIDQLGLRDKLLIKRPITANYVPFLSSPRRRGSSVQNSILPFDSPIHLLSYPGLSLVDKLRTGFLLASVKLNPFWQPLEALTAKRLFLTIGGRRAWETIWEPLMIGKFGAFADRVAASWLWARIKKRTPKLCYIAGGFHTLITALEKAIKHHGGTIITDTSVENIHPIGDSHPRAGGDPSLPKLWILGSSPRMAKTQIFDSVLLTIPTSTAMKLVPRWKLEIGNWSLNIPHLHAQTLILETKEPIFKDVYWLNIADRSFPFLAVVAHTNFMGKKHYGGHHLTYFGNYLPTGHPFLALSAKELFKKFQPYIQKLSPHFNFKFQISNFKLSNGWYAQPVHQLHYSHIAPKLETPIPNVYLANLDSIYPWDRGTNYAVELGVRAARFILSSQT